MHSVHEDQVVVSIHLGLIGICVSSCDGILVHLRHVRVKDHKLVLQNCEVIP